MPGGRLVIHKGARHRFGLVMVAAAIAGLVGIAMPAGSVPVPAETMCGGGDFVVSHDDLPYGVGTVPGGMNVAPAFRASEAVGVGAWNPKGRYVDYLINTGGGYGIPLDRAEGYFRFPTPPCVKEWPGKVYLRFSSGAGGSGPDGIGYELRHVPDSSWTSKTINWLNRPPGTEVLASAKEDANLLFVDVTAVTRTIEGDSLSVVFTSAPPGYIAWYSHLVETAGNPIEDNTLSGAPTLFLVPPGFDEPGVVWWPWQGWPPGFPFDDE